MKCWDLRVAAAHRAAAQGGTPGTMRMQLQLRMRCYRQLLLVLLLGALLELLSPAAAAAGGHTEGLGGRETLPRRSLGCPSSCKQCCVKHAPKCCDPTPAPPPPPPIPAGFVSWETATRAPEGCPFELSKAVTDVTYFAAGPENSSIASCTGRHPEPTPCTGADTW